MKERCGAKTRKGGNSKRASMSNGRCYRHGGATPSGLASPHFIHRRYSEALPAGLAPRFAASKSDPDLLELRAEIALIDARIEELLARVQTQETVGRWSEAKAVHQRMRVADQARRATDAATALAEPGDIFERGDADFDLWDQIGQLITLRARLVRTESQRMKDLQQMVAVDKVWTLVAAWCNPCVHM